MRIDVCSWRVLAEAKSLGIFVMLLEIGVVAVVNALEAVDIEETRGEKQEDPREPKA